MTGGSNIRAIGSEDAARDAAEADVSIEETVELTEDDSYEEWEPEEAYRPSLWRWSTPVLAILAVAGWTGFFGWAQRADILSGGTPQQWIGWITAWAVPVLLVVSLWILVTRNSRREAVRFGKVAENLSLKSAELEQRLSVVNRELSLAREFLGSQARDLESLGRVASERLSENADRLQTLVADNSRQIDSIAQVSTTALENMNRLRDDLPVIANSARDVSNQIGTAGRTAHGQIAELVSGFERLNAFGKASEQQVMSLQERIGGALATFETQAAEMEALVEARFGALHEKSEEFRTELDGREVEALAAMRRRADTLAEEFQKTRAVIEDEEQEAIRSLRARLLALREEAQTISLSVREGENDAIARWSGQIETLDTQLREAIEEIQRIDEQALEAANRKLEALRQEAEAVDTNIAVRDAKLVEQIRLRQSAMATDEAAAISALEERFAALDLAITERRESQLATAETLAERSESIAARIEGLRTVLSDISEQGESTQNSITGNIETLSARLDESKDLLAGTDSAVAELTEASVRLLELIQASSQHSSEILPAALIDAETRLENVRDQATELQSLIGEAGRKSEDLSAYVITARDTSREAIADLDGLQHRLYESHDEQDRRLASLYDSLTALAGQSDQLSERARTSLAEAIEALQQAAKSAPAEIETILTDRLGEFATEVSAKSAESVERAVEDGVTRSIARIEDSAIKAGTAGREITVQLRDQLAKVNELAGNLETRVARARELAEDQVGNDFARRVALITEALNSNSIDIAKAISTDVSDTAWASYLRGDRGIFTRRAVRLLDNTEARDIAETYAADPDFRENVSRYIHDFEAMLRTMLSTRDGNALGVTLLSSDMGKLYVALAQAIERLRD
uniref:ATPase n=1 Tax=Parerythrobacter lutipelagi TaxID=1964208 RepID=UPI0010F8078C|nr:ATPase [Parerythrobacter lutipelagi]